jgi:anthranilate/para-aminobenzoate synthase component II
MVPSPQRNVQMLLLIDNYDSFTYNLFQYFSELGEKVMVLRNNKHHPLSFQQKTKANKHE